MSNVVIMVWSQHMDAGFGDLLRGTIYLHQLSHKLKFELIVDTRLHPVSKLLVSHPHKYSNYVMEHKSKIVNMIHTAPKDMESFIKCRLMHNMPLLIVVNTYPNESLSIDCKRFMRRLLTPTDEFKKYFNEMCAKFRISRNYSIAHFRLGDQELNDNESDVEQYHKLCAMIDVQLATIPNLYIMSDSLTFKTYLRNSIRPELSHRIIPTKPIHLAVPNAHDIDKMRETMFDFMLLANSRVIKTHSIYQWVSNFVAWVSLIFDVPLFDLKPKMDMKLHVGAKTAPLPIPQPQNPPVSMSLFKSRLFRSGSFRTMF